MEYYQVRLSIPLEYEELVKKLSLMSTRQRRDWIIDALLAYCSGGQNNTTTTVTEEVDFENFIEQFEKMKEKINAVEMKCTRINTLGARVDVLEEKIDVIKHRMHGKEEDIVFQAKTSSEDSQDNIDSIEISNEVSSVEETIEPINYEPTEDEIATFEPETETDNSNLDSMLSFLKTMM